MTPDGYEEEVNGSTTTRRVTYAVAGQTVALRVQVVDSSSTLYYLHSDHPATALGTSLGSTSLATTTAGAVVSGSTSRYHPFGGFRTTPTAGLTDVGFTGHRHNNIGAGAENIGLIYMNARWFLPGIGRFASADTLVPNPTNPQSFNRYNYVRNNPLKYKDPTGHYECQANGICIDAITTLPSSPLPKPPAPLIKFDGFDGHTWTAAERTAVNSGAWQVARALYQASDGMFSSPREAFLSVLGGSVTFYKTSVTASNLGEATGKRKILVNNQASGGRITGPSHGTFWVAHELGHAFNYALSPNRTEPRFTHGQGLIDLAQQGVWIDGVLISGATSSTSWLGAYTRDFRGYESNTFPYIQNNTHSATEDFADMFSNYVHNSFAANNYGQERYDFMASRMRSWIALAVSNNE